ncbi:MAG: hypothetical protein GXZ08_01180 [Tissierellia bacterium]|nr:hypothetical protein [Tissierellia bacterium]
MNDSVMKMEKGFKLLKIYMILTAVTAIKLNDKGIMGNIYTVIHIVNLIIYLLALSNLKELNEHFERSYNHAIKMAILIIVPQIIGLLITPFFFREDYMGMLGIMSLIPFVVLIIFVASTLFQIVSLKEISLGIVEIVENNGEERFQYIVELSENFYKRVVRLYLGLLGVIILGFLPPILLIAVISLFIYNFYHIYKGYELVSTCERYTMELIG